MSLSSERFTVETEKFQVVLEKEPDDFEVLLTTTRLEKGLELIHLQLSSPNATVPATYRLTWQQPLVDIQAFWRPGTDRSRSLPADWSDSWVSQSTTHAPVGCLFNQSGQNRQTFALSDALNPLEIKAGVNEETADFIISVMLFPVKVPMSNYTLTLRLDYRFQPYYQSLHQVQQWWAQQPGYTPAEVPELARQPMYSTWYSFHQNLIAEQVEQEVRLAQELGCRTLIVDDGWQTASQERGYAYCGDWEVFGEKIPDMPAHVAQVQASGLKFMLWYALPFVGAGSRAFSQFQGKYLGFLPGFNTWVLDPRFLEIRQYLIAVCEKALVEWDVDGFKIDFVQHFKQPTGELLSLTSLGGRDYISVLAATDRLLSDLLTRLHQIKPDIMIEFRQPYIGPLMRKYGNMFRAGDCPNDSLNNRVRTLDVRLLSGASAPHSDMLMWHPADRVESAALQILNVLFAVPQISVRLSSLPAVHLKMLKFWLAFWQANSELLLDGELKPFQPELLYPLVEVSNQNRLLIAVYARLVVTVTNATFDELMLVNATLQAGLILEFKGKVGSYQLEIYDCGGELTSQKDIDLQPGLISLAIPPAGLARLKSFPAR